MIGASGLEGLRLDCTGRVEVAADVDGYPAVVVRDRVWVDEPDQWIVAGGVGDDLEDRVRDLAAALVGMADWMREERKAQR